jgi:nitric oxide reductase large subunit
MEDKILSDEELKGIENIFPVYYKNYYTPNEMNTLAKNIFPEKYMLWSREKVGGNDAIHKTETE